MAARKSTFLKWTLVVVSCAFLTGASGCGGDAEPVSDADIEQAKTSLQPFKKQLQMALKEGLKEGPENAIGVCRDKAPEIAKELKSDGIEVGRVSLRARNPENVPEPWMEPLLADYVERVDDRTPRTVRLEDGSIGYVEPIYIQPLCLKCHGKDIPGVVQEKLTELYPSDVATGYESGDFRGLFWVRMSNR